MNMKGTIYQGKEVNFDEVIGEATFHHQALAGGYVSRRVECIIEDYHGRFGDGYIVSYPNYKSTRYKIVQYYIK